MGEIKWLFASAVSAMRNPVVADPPCVLHELVINFVKRVGKPWPLPTMQTGCLGSTRLLDPALGLVVV